MLLFADAVVLYTKTFQPYMQLVKLKHVDGVYCFSLLVGMAVGVCV